MLTFSDSSLASLISEMRVFMSGVEVEPVQDYGRLVETLNRGISLENALTMTISSSELVVMLVGRLETSGFGPTLVISTQSQSGLAPL